MKVRPPAAGPRKATLASDVQLARRLFGEARGSRWLVAALLAVELLSIPIGLLGPLPLKLAVDSVVQARPLPAGVAPWLGGNALPRDELLVRICLLSVSIALLGQLQGMAAALLTTFTRQRLLLAFRSRLLLHAERLSLDYHTRRGTADTIYRLQSDAGCLDWMFIDGLIPLVSSSLTLGTMLAVIFSIHGPIGLTALAISPVLVALTRASRPLLRRQSRELKGQESDTSRVVQEVLGILRVVKAFGQEEREVERFRAAARRAIRSRLRLTLTDEVMGLAINVAAAVGLAGVMYFGILSVLEDELTLGAMLLVSSYVSKLYSPLKTISRKSVTVQNQLAGAERAFALLDEPREVPEPLHPQPLGRSEGRLAFEGVGFSYDGERTVLADVTFDVPKGCRVGIVGRSGAGKTTLIHLLGRFYDPTAGVIRLDGRDLREYAVADLRRQFAIVFQEPVLFDGTLAENIAYARPGASLEEVRAAAEAANIHPFIDSLPQGYDTRVGERGMTLSGGERQRIGLARAFLRDAPILILDEPTSSVDHETEAGILDALEPLIAGRTTLIIAHRPQTLRSCDRILRVEGGQVSPARAEEIPPELLV